MVNVWGEYDREMSEEQRLLKESLLSWAEKNLSAERVIKMNQQGYPFPRDIIKGLADLGVIMGVVPPEHGGAGLSWQDQALIADIIGYIEPSIATAAGLMAVETGWGFTIDRYASDEVREKYVRHAIEGRKIIGIASTEPQGGSDVAGMKTSARKEGDEWVLNGEKTFISGVYECREMGGGYWVVARTDKADKPHKELSSFFVPIDSEGLEITEAYRDAGRGSLSTAGFVLHDVRVPDNYMLGERGKGFYQTMEGFDNARLLIAASSCGVTRRILEEAGKYISERELFGHKLAQYEGISFEFADFYANLEMIRCTYQHVAQMQDIRYREEGMPVRTGKARTYKPQEIAKWIAILKWKAPHMAKDAADRAMHWLGAAGYTDEYILETAWRGVMSYCVGAEGGENIQKIVIARESLGDVAKPY